MAEEVKKDVVKTTAVKKKNYTSLKVIGVALIVVTMLLFFAVASLIALRFSSGAREWFVDTFKIASGDNLDSPAPVLNITEDENVVINVVKQSEDSVVSIAISQVTLRQGEGVVDTSSNIGTGFIVDPNGIIVTNQHVVSNTSVSYKIITKDGKEYTPVEIVRDDNSDIAIIKVDATSLPALELGDSDNLVAGQTVIAIGTPLGQYAGSVTTGVISGLNRSVSTSSGWFGSTAKVYEDVIQTDAAVNPGNSGGPLISTEGKVIGVNFATTSGADNISFALPINKVKDRLEEYRTFGKFIRPYLGVSYQMISQYEAMYYDNVVPGALVVSIDSDSPAGKIDIKRGDIITKIDGKNLSGSLSSAIQSHKVGDEMEMELWNNGNTRSVKVTLEEAS